MLGDVGEPDAVGCAVGELALDQVVMGGRIRAVPLLAVVADPVDPGLAHQPRHPFAPDPQAQAHPQFGMHPRCPLGAA